MKRATVVSGLHQGRQGNVVSTPWLGNLFHLRLTLNVPATELEIIARYSWQGYVDRLIQEKRAGHGPREWIKVWRWQIKEV